MSIADNKLSAVQASLYKALQEGSPIQFLLTQRYISFQDQAFAIRFHPAGNQNSCLANLTINLNLLL